MPTMTTTPTHPLLHNIFLAEHVMVNGDTELAYVPLVKMTPADNNMDYWTYDGRYSIFYC